MTAVAAPLPVLQWPVWLLARDEDIIGTVAADGTLSSTDPQLTRAWKRLRRRGVDIVGCVPDGRALVRVAWRMPLCDAIPEALHQLAEAGIITDFAEE